MSQRSTGGSSRSGFVARDHNVRGLKDALSRDILAALYGAGIRIGPATP
jgi:hypothetical protein